MDPWRRVFPELPKKPFPPAHIQYEPGTELHLKPHPTHPRGATTSVQLRVVNLFKSGHGRVSQVLGCLVKNGPSSINGIKLVACAYDPLYASVEDLMEIIDHDDEMLEAGRPSTLITNPDVLLERMKKNDSPMTPTQNRKWVDEIINLLGNPKPLPSRPRIFESRKGFMERSFTHEVRVYDALSQLEGICIPRCWGGYTLTYEDREFHEDSSVNVLLFELINGITLSNTWAHRYSAIQKSVMCDQIGRIARNMNNRGVVWPCVFSDNFIVEQGTGRIIAYDFTGTLLRDQSHSRYKMEVDSQNNLIDEFLRRLELGSVTW